MLRLLTRDEADLVTLDGKPVSGAFALDEKNGVIRRYVLDGQGKPVLEGQRYKIETLCGQVCIEQQGARKNRKPSEKDEVQPVLKDEAKQNE